jgi:hypothetical protein
MIEGKRERERGEEQKQTQSDSDLRIKRLLCIITHYGEIVSNIYGQNGLRMALAVFTS